MVIRVNQFKQSSVAFPSPRSRVRQKPESSHFLTTTTAGKYYKVLPGLELCSSDPETQNSNCSSWPLGLPSQRYDLFRSDCSARLIRAPKRRGQSPQAKKFTPERAATNATSVFHRRSCNSGFYTCNKIIHSDALSCVLLSSWPDYMCVLFLTFCNILITSGFSDAAMSASPRSLCAGWKVSSKEEHVWARTI